MNRQLYCELVEQKRRLIQRLLMKNLPFTRERMIICENLWTMFSLKVYGKVKSERIKTPEEAVRIFKRQAKDAKSEYFRINANKAKSLLNDFNFVEQEITDNSSCVFALYEDQDILKRIIAQLNNAEVEFLNIAFLQGLRYAEVASILHISISNVKTKVTRLLKKMKMIYRRLR
jgi:DNA-binding CsgD family transcriptional regulator